jgi:hypothetical protein
VRSFAIWVILWGVLMVASTDALATVSSQVVSRASYESDLPTVAVSPQGLAVVGWVEQRRESSSPSVWLAAERPGGRFAGGQALSTAVTSPDPGFVSPSGLAMTVGRGGTATVVWSTSVGRAGLLVYRQRTLSGRLSQIRTLDHMGLGNFAACMTRLPDGRALLIYERVPLSGAGFHGALSTVFARVLGRDGRFSPAQRLSRPGTQLDGVNPLGVGAITVARGRTVVVWAWSRHLPGRRGVVFLLEYRFRSRSGVWSAPRPVPGTVNVPRDYPAVFPLQADLQGDVLIAWNPTPDSFPTASVRAVWLDGASSRVRPVRGLPSVDASYQTPAFALGAHGSVTEAWETADGNDSAINAATGQLARRLGASAPIWGPIAQTPCSTQPFCTATPGTPEGPVQLVSTAPNTMLATWYAITSYTADANRQIAHSRTLRLVTRIAHQGRWTSPRLLPNMPAPLFVNNDNARSNLVPDTAGGAYDAFLIGTPTGLNRVEVAHIHP